MTVSELIVELQKLPGDLLVLVSSDAEGNSIGELADVDDSWGRKYGWEWETLHPDDIEVEKQQAEEWEEEWDPEGKTVKVAVLWPV